MEILMFHINQRFNDSIKRLTLYLQYHGLSRLGINVLTNKGICVHPRTSDRNINKRLSLYDAKISTIIRTGMAIIGIDNYNHCYGSPVISAERKMQLLLANYTVCGISHCQNTIDNHILLDGAGASIASLPNKKIVFAAFVQTVVNEIKAAMNAIFEETKNKFSYWTISDVVQENLAAVPLRAQNRTTNPQTRGRRWFKPWFVSGRNCASNEGILHIFTTIYNEYQHNFNQGIYGYFKADVTLFIKYFQVLIAFF
jgi:hypothetical protein